MKSTYLVVASIIVVAFLGFFFAKKDTEAPMQNKEEVVSNNNSNLMVTLGDGSYNLDTNSSVLKWTGENVVGFKHTGTLKFESGGVSIKEGKITSGNFVLDLNTIADDGQNQKLVDHLKSDDFFSVAKYPKSTFVLKTFAPSSSEGAKLGRYVIGGDLTIKGISQPISFTVTVISGSPEEISAKGSFAINRADWQVKYGSSSFFKDLGDKAIRDAVYIELDLKALKVIQ